VLVDRVLVEGYSAAEAAKHFRVSRSTAYKWLWRFRAEGTAGLADRSSRPHHSPRALPPEAIAVILAMRHYRRYGPHRLAPLTGHPRSTIYGVLRRAGSPRLDGLDRLTGRSVRRRYVEAHPGALLHQDHKQIPRIPGRGTPRASGRSWRDPNGRWTGYHHLEVFVDDHSRLAWVVGVPDLSPVSAAGALRAALRWYADHGIRVERLLTDNGTNYTSPRFTRQLEELGIRHTRTRPRRPQTNGKVERFIGTLLTEWAYRRRYRTDEERLRALYRYLAFYNRRRPHTALNGRSPLDVLSTT
jgi:transposase InsO family protein